MANQYKRSEQEFNDEGQLRSHTEIKEEKATISPYADMTQGMILTIQAIISVVIIGVIGCGAIGIMVGTFFSSVQQQQEIRK